MFRFRLVSTCFNHSFIEEMQKHLQYKSPAVISTISPSPPRVYSVFFAPKKEQQELKEIFLSRDAILERTYHQGEVFLANIIRHIKWPFYKAKNIPKAWIVEEE